MYCIKIMNMSKNYCCVSMSCKSPTQKVPPPASASFMSSASFLSQRFEMLRSATFLKLNNLSRFNSHSRETLCWGKRTHNYCEILLDVSGFAIFLVLHFCEHKSYEASSKNNAMRTDRSGFAFHFTSKQLSPEFLELWKWMYMRYFVFMCPLFACWKSCIFFCGATFRNVETGVAP